MARTYQQACALARAADLLGERWTWLLVRDLLVAPRRYGELEQRLSGIGANLLSKRLKDLTAAGLVAQRRKQDGYELTAAGRALEDVVLELIRWELRWGAGPALEGDLHFPDWDLLALKALFQPGKKLRRPILARFADGDWEGWAQTDGLRLFYGVDAPPRAPDIDFAAPVAHLQRPSVLLKRLTPERATLARVFLGYFASPKTI